MRRRDVIQSFAAASLSAILPHTGNAAGGDAFYDVGRFGDARVLHLTDTHAQLLPVYFREPSVNIGVGSMAGQPPHLVGRAFLDHFGIKASDREAYALTFLDYRNAAHRFGRMGGFAHLKTLIDRLRAEAGNGHSVLLDGGDLWQGSGLANATDGAAMIEVANLLGIEAMTGHWEFTYGEKILRRHLKDFKGEFLAQNVFLSDEAAFNNAPVAARRVLPGHLRRRRDLQAWLRDPGRVRERQVALRDERLGWNDLYLPGSPQAVVVERVVTSNHLYGTVTSSSSDLQRRTRTTRVFDSESCQPSFESLNSTENGSNGMKRASVRPRICGTFALVPSKRMTRVPVISFAKVQPNAASKTT